jgi:hypothetical protein
MDGYTTTQDSSITEKPRNATKPTTKAILYLPTMISQNRLARIKQTLLSMT